MANFILKLHVNGNGVTVDPRFGFVVENSTISYTVEEGDQVTLPNYNMIRKSGHILVGWTETSGSPAEGDRVYIKYFEPADGHVDLYPVFMELNVGSVKTANIAKIQQTTTTMTPYNKLGTAEKVEADAARAQFSAEVSEKVDDYIGSNIEQIVLENMGTAIEDAFNQVRDEVIGSITELGSRLDVVEENTRTIDDNLIAMGTRVETVENGLSITNSSVSSLSDEVSVHTNKISSIEEDIVISSANTAEISNRMSSLAFEISSQNARISGLEDDIIVVSSQTVELGSSLSAEITQQASKISSLEDDVFIVSSRISELDSATLNIVTRIGSLDDDIVTINHTIGSIDNRVLAVETEYATVGSKVDATISSVNKLAEDQSSIMGSIASIDSKVSSISTQWVKEIVEETNTEIKLTKSCTFVLSTITAECSVVIPTNFRYVTKLKDYKISTDYVNNFGSMGTISWYENGVLLTDDTPVNGGDVLFGNRITTSSFEIFALPVFEVEQKFAMTGYENKYATNYGIVVVQDEDGNPIYKSNESYNPRMTAGFGQIMDLQAKERNGCKFIGWCKVDGYGNVLIPSEKIGTDGGYEATEDVTSGLVSQESSYRIIVDEDVKYGALFLGEDPDSNDLFSEIVYEEDPTPSGFVYKFKSDGNEIDSVSDAMLSQVHIGAVETNPSLWSRVGECSEFIAEDPYTTRFVVVSAYNKANTEVSVYTAGSDNSYKAEETSLVEACLVDNSYLLSEQGFIDCLSALFGDGFDFGSTAIWYFGYDGVKWADENTSVMFKITNNE